MRALEIDESLAEAHTTLGATTFLHDWNWSAAEREFKRAIELNPNSAAAHSWHGFYLAAMERLDEALVEMKRAQALDPLSLGVNAGLGDLLIAMRQPDQAIEQFQKTLELDPKFSTAIAGIGEAYLQKGMSEKAIAEFQKAQQLEDTTLVWLGYAHAVSGNRAEAEKVLTLLKQYSVRHSELAQIYAALGDKDRAFSHLEKAFEARDPALVYLKINQHFDGLRSDQRFTDLQRRVGLAL